MKLMAKSEMLISFALILSTLWYRHMPHADAAVDRSEHVLAFEQNRALAKNLTTPIFTKDTLSFVVLSHIYPILFDSPRADIDTMIAEITSCSPEFLIITGDVITGTFDVIKLVEKSNKNKTDLKNDLERQWDHVFTVFEKLNVPVWIAPGNHDVSSYKPSQQETVKEIFHKRIGPDFHAKSVSGYTLLFLNTSVSSPFNCGMGREQIDWLKKEIDNPSSSNLIIFLHHPLWYGGYKAHPGNVYLKSSVDWMAEIHPMLVQRPVIAVFAGDGGDRFNFMFYEYRDDLLYFINGSGRRGVSFLDVKIANGKLFVYPHFLDMQVTSVTREKMRSRGYYAYIDKFKNIMTSGYFMTGFTAGLLVSGMIYLIRKRTKR